MSEHQLSPDLVQLQDMLHRFVAEQIEPRIGAIEASNDIPDDLLAKAAELGLFGMSIPEEYGGMGVSELASSIAVEALSHGPGGATFYLAPSAPAAAIRLAGNEAQCQRFLPKLASGEAYAAFCLSESGAGSDAAGIQTRAVRTGNTWRINGSKLWISRATRADVFLVSAVTDPSLRGKGAITVFVMEKRAGIEVGRPDRQIGLSGSGSAEVTFNDVEVSEEDVLGKVGDGFGVLKFILGRARLWAAARATGICARALKVSLEHAASREQFGKKLGDFQAIKLKLAEMASDVYISRLLLYRAARLYDEGLDPVQEVSIAKLFATEAASRAADMAIQIHGAMGVSRDFHVERLYRDARAYRILDGTSDIQRLMISSNVQRRGASGLLAPGGL